MSQFRVEELLLYVAAAAGLCISLSIGTSSAEAAGQWPFDAKPAAGVSVQDHDATIALFNRHTGLTIRKADGVLLGIWHADGTQVADNTIVLGAPSVPLWSAQLYVPGDEKPVGVDPNSAQRTYAVQKSDDGGQSIVMRCAGAAAGELKCDVTLRIGLAPQAQRFTWTASAKVTQGAASIWTLTYPQLAVPGIDGESNTNRRLIPYRRGVLGSYGKDDPRYDTQQPYPGPAAKFQFMAAYGEKSARGMYMASEDGRSFNKSFIQRNYPARNCMLLAIEHWPDNRGVAGTGYEAPYAVVAGAFEGDWWHACRIYREWWVKQVWAGKGLLVDRSDVPDWVKRSVVVTRPSTTQVARTVPNNLKGSAALSEAMGGRPFFGIWYGVFENRTGSTAGLDGEGHGHISALKPGISDALAQLRKRDVHHAAYVQSIIYDPTVGGENNPDGKEADKWVGRDQKGTAYLYGPPKYAMCRATKWWQQRIVDIATNAVANGFEGVYLDSFGKGASECFDPSHGHSLGGGNTVTEGQREMAQRVLEAMRKINPDAILSGEAPTEAYRDLLHVALYAKNTWGGYAPVFRAVWGDYSLGFGRVIRPSKKGPENMIPEMGTLFIEGAVIGRVFTDSGSTVLLDPQYTAQLAYVQAAADYTLAGMDYLRFGEYLHPLDLGTLPTVTFSESVEEGAVTNPAVLHSVNRSHRDGSVAVVLTNISTQPVSLEVPIEPSLRASGAEGPAVLQQMDRKGGLKELARGDKAWRQKVTIEAGEIVFLVVR